MFQFSGLYRSLTRNLVVVDGVFCFNKWINPNTINVKEIYFYEMANFSPIVEQIEYIQSAEERAGRHRISRFFTTKTDAASL